MRKYFVPGSILAAGCSFFLLFYITVFQHSFEDFTMELFCREISGNTLNLHYTLTEPEAYGIEESEASFGTLSKEAADTAADELKSCREQLASFMERGLQGEELLTAEILDWWLAGQIDLEKYYYYQEPLGPTLGTQAQLPVLLAEFPFRNQQDIDTYLQLLTALPDYFRQLAAFEKEKSEQGLFMNDEILDKILEQCQSLFPIDETHFLVTTFQDRLKSCDFLNENEKISYEVSNLRILKDYMQKAYDELCQSMESLRGAGVNTHGLYHLPDGVEYYEFLLRYNIGTDRSIAEIRRLLEDQMATDYETILYALYRGIDPSKIDDDSPSEQDPAQILSRLRTQIEKDFPKADDVSWQIKEVPDTLAEFLSPAFYMTPAIDAAEQNVIYINPSYEPSRTELITTLAHEGYPGHLYQNSFENRPSCSPVRNLVYIGGYTEGWGMYSEFYAYDFLGLPDLEADLLRALTSLNYAVCASLDLSIHGEGWSEEECVQYLSSFGIADTEQIHELYLNILEEPSNYLKYYLGYLEICKLKESALALSSELTVYDFHKWFLETGPAPFSVLRDRLELLKVSPQVLQSTDQNVHLLALEAVHNRLNHFLMKSGVFFVSGNSLLSQG